jgi:hypothetical protein
MIKLWLANVAPEASDDDLRALIKTYAPDLDCTDVQREAGDGSRPAAIVAVPGASRGALDKACARLNGMFWKGRAGCPARRRRSDGDRPTACAATIGYADNDSRRSTNR